MAETQMEESLPWVAIQREEVQTGESPMGEGLLWVHLEEEEEVPMAPWEEEVPMASRGQEVAEGARNDVGACDDKASCGSIQEDTCSDHVLRVLLLAFRRQLLVVSRQIRDCPKQLHVA